MATSSGNRDGARIGATQRRLVYALREPVPSFVWLLLAGLVCNMFAGNWQYFGVPIGPDRVLLLLAVVLLVLDPATRLPKFELIHGVMLAAIGWVAFSWMQTGSVHDTIKAFALSDRVVVPLAMFMIGGLVFSTEWRRILLLRTLSLLGVYLGVTAVGEITSTTALVWPHFILDNSLGIQFGRARGPYLESEAMGMACALTFFSSGLLIARSSGLWRWLGITGATGGLVGVALCLTRTVWISTLVATVLIAVLVPTLRRWAPIIFSAVIAATAVALASLPSVANTVNDRLTAKRSVYDRVTTNDAALRVVDTHPLLGVGWGRFVDVSPLYIQQGDTIPLTTVDIEVHNVFLSRAAETGVIGSALWIACMLLGPVRTLTYRQPTTELQGWRLLTLAAVLVWLLPSLLSPNNYPQPNNLIWLISGVATVSTIPLRGRARSAAAPPLNAASST